MRRLRSLVFRLNKTLQRPISNRKGVALIMAVSALVILTYLAMEVSYDSNVEYTVNAQALNRIKAYHAAKSALQLGLLRVKIYQQLNASPAAAALGPLIDQVWKMKLAWPIPIPSEMNAVDRDTLAKAKTESMMDGSWDLDIQDEGSKIDLNDLVSPSKKMREITREQVLTIFKQAEENDDDWRKKMGSLRPEQVVNFLTDWQSDKFESAGGGDKRAAFAKLGPGFPPNRAFRTMAEVRLVPEMTEEIYELLVPRLTIYGMKAINPNTADRKVLLSLDPSFTDKIVDDLDKFRKGEEGGPFVGADDTKCSEHFWSTAQRYGARPAQNANQIPMTCKSLSTFKITATGIFGEGKNSVRRDIEVVVMNLSQSANRVKKLVDEEKKAAATSGATGTTTGTTATTTGTTATTTGATGTTTGGNATSGNTGSNNSNEPLPKGPPRIVYWKEQ